MKTDWSDYVEERHQARSLLKLCIRNMGHGQPPKGGYTDKLMKAENCPQAYTLTQAREKINEMEGAQ